MTDVAVARPETGVSRRTLVAGAAWSIPVVIGAAAATKGLLSLPLDGSDVGKWLAVLALYDLIFGLLAYAVFDFLLED